jgi:hypothetical protein
MIERVNPFADLSDVPVFTTKAKPDKPVEKEIIARIAEDNNFPSRQAARPAKIEKRKPRTYRTGRNTQFHAKATPETIQRFYKLADEKKVPLGELLKLGVDALDIVGRFEKLADKKHIPAADLIQQALDTLDGAGVAP